MFGEEAGEFHHVDGVGRAEYGREFVVWDDEAFVFLVLEVVFFDVDPEGFCYFGAREFGGLNDGLELFR